MSLKQFVFFSLFVILCPVLRGQTTADFELFPLPSIQPITSIELSPDKKLAAFGTSQGPLYLWDVNTKEVSRKIDVSGFYAGPRLKFSGDGKYLLMQQQFYTNFNANKDKPVRIDILDISSGSKIFSKDNVHAAKLLADNESVALLQGNDFSVYNFISGTKTASHTFRDAEFAMAVSPDMSTILISHKSEKEDLDELPFYRTDKKAKKRALKKTHVVAAYDFKTFKKIGLIQEIFDLVFSASYSTDGKDILIYTLPHSRTGARPGGLLGFLSKADAKTFEVTRATFMSRLGEPDWEISADKRSIAVPSIETRPKPVLQIILYDYATASINQNFDLNTRFLEVNTSGRVTCAYMPDCKSLLIAYGHKLAIWKMQE